MPQALSEFYIIPSITWEEFGVPQPNMSVAVS